MRLFEQLQLFPRRLASAVAASSPFHPIPAAAAFRQRDPALEAMAQELLGTIAATAPLGQSLRVEWNGRLRTAAGRADYRQNLISLNPRLREHGPAEIDRTLRHELAHLLAHFRKGRRRIAPHGAEWRQACADLGIAGEMRCHTLAFPTRRPRRRFFYRCPQCAQEFPRVRRIRGAVACLACCRRHSRGRFDDRFRLRLTRRA